MTKLVLKSRRKEREKKNTAEILISRISKFIKRKNQSDDHRKRPGRLPFVEELLEICWTFFGCYHRKSSIRSEKCCQRNLIRSKKKYSQNTKDKMSVRSQS